MFRATLAVGSHYYPYFFSKQQFLCTYIFDFFVCFLSSIAMGREMCRLGGVIITQIVLFCTLFITGFEHFLCSNQPN